MNLATNTASVGLAAMAALANGGTLKLYSGTIPATPQTAIGAQTLLATFTLNTPAFGTPTYNSPNETTDASFVSNSVTPVANGTVAWARLLKSDGTTVVGDFSVGTSGTDVVIGNTSLVTTINVSVTSFRLQLPAVG